MKKTSLVIAAASLGFLALPAQADEAAKANWDKHCKKCHAEDGSGKTRIGEKLEIKDYTKPETLAEVSDEDLFKMTKDGIEGTKMPGYADKLSDEEINALVDYMRAMAKS